MRVGIQPPYQVALMSLTPSSKKGDVAAGMKSDARLFFSPIWALFFLLLPSIVELCIIVHAIFRDVVVVFFFL